MLDAPAGRAVPIVALPTFVIHPVLRVIPRDLVEHLAGHLHQHVSPRIDQTDQERVDVGGTEVQPLDALEVCLETLLRLAGELR
ncbi:hypothetical protein NRS6194_04177 [Bacillus subtilis]|nr:hypothetical protein NRS6194_04177 [Bacillus subtilis]